MAPACCLVLLSLKRTSVGADYQQWPWNALLDFYLFSFFLLAWLSLYYSPAPFLSCGISQSVDFSLRQLFIISAVLFNIALYAQNLHVLNGCTFLTRVFKYNSQWYQLVITLLSLGILKAGTQHANILLLRHLPAQLKQFPLLRVPCNCLTENSGICTIPVHVKFDFQTGNILQTWQ